MKSRSVEAVKALQNLISTRKLASGARLPSSRDIARQTGFPRYVMDRACQELINRGLLVRTGYMLRVGSITPGSWSIEGEVHVLSYLENFSLIAGRILTKHGVKYRVFDLSFVKHNTPAPVLRRVMAEKPSGIILWMPAWLDVLKPMLKDATIPMVICADAAPPELGQSSAGTDIYRGTEKALRHLVGLGHRQIAFASLRPPSDSIDVEMTACYRNLCRQMGLSKSATAVWKLEPGDEEASGEFLREQRRRHPEVTALFAGAEAAVLVANVFRVPRDLSVVSFYEPQKESRSPLTTLALRDPERILSWACSEIIAQIRAVESGFPPKLPQQVLFVPDLVERGSTRAPEELPRRRGGAEEEGRTAGLTGQKDRDAGSELGVGSSKSEVSPWESWRKTYPYLEKRKAQNWRQLDLSNLANHSITREHGWLGGEPLLHLSPGLRSIHGVPFQVIDERRNDNRAVVTFRSPHTHSASAKELPSSVKLPVGGCVKALYFLHGCGYARPTCFAEYVLHFKRGKPERVPLVAQGASRSLALKQLGRLKPNLQDWYSSYEQQDFPHAKHVTLFDPANPGDYKRCLYTLEWINPRPGEEISHIEVRVDPKAGPALAIIAVTALV